MKHTHVLIGKLCCAKLFALFLISFVSTGRAQVSAPAFAPGPGDCPVWFDVNITGTGTIRFTIDGTAPITSSTLLGGDGNVRILQSLTLKARAWDTSNNTSAITTGVYRVTGLIDGGGTHSLWLKSNRALYGFGNQVDGRIGNGQTTGNTTTAQSVRKENGGAGTAFVTAVDAVASYTHSLILDEDGFIWATGDNAYGALGQNNTTELSYARRVLKSTATTDYLTGIAQIAAGQYFSLALDADGAVWGWGLAQDGQLGEGTNSSGAYNPFAGRVRKSATSGDELSGIAHIAAGDSFAFAVDSSAKVWSWGTNTSAQLGRSTPNSSDRTYAALVKIDANGTDLTDVTEVTAGSAHAAAIRVSGSEDYTVWSWGEQADGRLGNGSTSSAGVMFAAKVQKDAAQVGQGQSADLSGVIQVAAGPRHTLALDNQGRVWSWGYNADGQLGHHSTTSHGYADLVIYQGEPLAGIVAIGAGGSDAGGSVTGFSFAIDGFGQVYAWGKNAEGQLGDATTTTRTSPVLAGSALRLLNQTPSVALAVTGPFYAPANLTLTATASDTDGSISRVDFLSGQTGIGFKTSTPYTFSWSGVAVGTYSLSATATDDYGTSATSSAVSVNVVPPSIGIQPSTSELAEASASDGILTVTRATGAPLSTSLTIAYSTSGTATAGSDYVSLPGTVVIPVGQTSVTIAISSISDAVDDADETIIVTLTDGGSSYSVGTPGSATITLKERVPVSSGLRLNLQSDLGVQSDGSGNIGTWQDQSGNGYDATQSVADAKPLLVTNALNGRPVVRFNGTSNYLTLLNVMAAATAGEMFTVVKATEDAPATTHGFLRFGTNAYGTTHPWSDKLIYDDFGTATLNVVGDPGQALDQFHTYNASSRSGEWIARINGLEQFRNLSNTVAFSSTIWISKRNYGNFFAGDIAALLVYDRVLEVNERRAVEGYLSAKYGLVTVPSAPTNLTARAISSSQVSLAWSHGFDNSSLQFRVERKTGTGAFTQLAVVYGARSYIDQTAQAGISYTYRVQTVNHAGASGYSNEVPAQTLGLGSAMPLTGIRLWLRADAAANTPVSAWQDQSGSGKNAVQGTGVNQPTLVANVLNGQPVVRFNGTAGFVALPSVMSGATAGEMFAVTKAQSDSPTANQGFMRFGTNAYGATHPWSDKKIYDDFGTATLNVVGDPAQPSLDQFHIYNVSSQAGEWVARLNGLALFRNTSNTVSFSSTVWIGKRAYGDYFSGDLAEVIVYDRVLTSHERKAVEKYLDQRYLIPALDADGDGLTNAEESALGTDPYDYDTNRDGLSDGADVTLGFSATSTDVDGDGVSNLAEIAAGMNPLDPDSDGDGRSDGLDAFPLDPSRQDLPAPTPGDTQPPVITLTEPALPLQP